MNAVKFILGLSFCAAIIGCSVKSPSSTIIPPSVSALDSLLTPIAEIEAAYSNQQSDFSITVKGIITSILSDDTTGDKHQRFIVELANAQTLLVTHNIGIAPRVSGIRIGSTVYVHGDYVWNSQGGLVHWTHHDPSGIHEDGWIVFGDSKFQ